MGKSYGVRKGGRKGGQGSQGLPATFYPCSTVRGTIGSGRLGTTNSYKYLQSFSAGGRDILVRAWLRWGQCGAGLHPRKAKLLPGSM